MINPGEALELTGTGLAFEIYDQVKNEVDRLKKKAGRTPGLAVIMIGDDPASQIYVTTKNKKAAKIGIKSEICHFSPAVSPQQIKDKIAELNQRQDIDGILIQVPLPKVFDTWDIIEHINPDKDVDGFHPVNLGRLFTDHFIIAPCTPWGIIRLMDHYQIKTSGLDVVVIGRSIIVGKPLAALLTNRHATVTICHTQTKNLPQICSRADMVVAAIGKAGFVTAEMIKAGAVLIDVGTNYLTDRDEIIRIGSAKHLENFNKTGHALIGDFHFQAYKKASAYTPVPGGVGVMTVAILMLNTLLLYKAHEGLMEDDKR